MTTDVIDEVKVATNQQASNLEPKLELNTSRNFCNWMVENHVSLAFTTYQAGKVFFIGLKSDKELSMSERTFARCMGICTDAKAQTVYLSSLYQIWRFENSLPEQQQTEDGFDRVYLPQVAYTTGDVDVHDMAVDANGELIFVNTLFSCLCKLSTTHSFEVIWKPAFITKLAAEDRCHMNGVAMVEGQPRYVSLVGCADVAEGWRDHRHRGGIVMDVTSNETICEGLSMPHSPRVYQNQLWLLESGTGHFGYVDIPNKTFKPIAFCPGYARGMAFAGDYAIVATSHTRDNKTFSELKFQENLAKKNANTKCGIHVINLKTGDVEHSLTIEGVIQELYDVIILPKVVRPQAIGTRNNQIKHTISIKE